MSSLPTGLYKRHQSYLVRHKVNGRWKLTGVGKDLGQALERHQKLRSPGAHDESGVTLAQLVEPYLKRQQLYSKPRTVEYARLTSARLMRFFRSRPVQTLRDADLEAFVAYRLETIEPVSVNTDLRTLKAILRLGVEQRQIKELPFKIRMLKVTKRRQAHIFTPEEIQRLLSAAEPRERALLLICASTGARLEEVLHLKWSDMDWTDQKLSIRAKEGWTTKSHHERSMFVSDEVISFLKRFRDARALNRPEDWIFQSHKRKGQRLSSPWKPLRDAFTRAGLYRPGKITHEIRRAVASTMLLKGTPIHVVKEILGHSTITTTELYAFTTEEAKREASKNALV